MSDEIDNPYSSPQGASAEEDPQNPRTNGMVELILHGAFIGARCFVASFVVMFACFVFLYALLNQELGILLDLMGVLVFGLFLGTVFGWVSGALHGIAWYYFQDQPQRFSLLMASGCLYSILVLEGPLVVYLYPVFIFIGESLILLFCMQAIAICLAVWRLNLNFYNKLFSGQLVEE